MNETMIFSGIPIQKKHLKIYTHQTRTQKMHLTQDKKQNIGHKSNTVLMIDKYVVNDFD